MRFSKKERSIGCVSARKSQGNSMVLRAAELLDLVVQSVRESGWRPYILDAHKPFLIQIAKEDMGAALRIYIWNCTHGGGPARPESEYRIQFTGVVPVDDSRAITLLLGWHDYYGVFVAWDIGMHSGQDSSSPSAQVRAEVMEHAHINRFSVGNRGNGEVVIAFRPEFLVDYALNSRVLHHAGENSALFNALNQLPAINPWSPDESLDGGRSRILMTIARSYRAADFRRRVLNAYGHMCAVCGIQLNLVEAAHILPVAISGSTDETFNGVSLCALHHAAYDSNLISFDEGYRIQVNESKCAQLETIERAGGIGAFCRALRPMLILPVDRRDYPPAGLISHSRSVRGWN